MRTHFSKGPRQILCGIKGRDSDRLTYEKKQVTCLSCLEIMGGAAMQKILKQSKESKGF